ncbi:MAG: RHO alpha subunit C-terminal catalytic domain-containing protein [Actinomycetota bacterium]|nr:RHO alpha subunit C-terminal catalytic domain-containing protein [Actinomycetota bacterium]
MDPPPIDREALRRCVGDFELARGMPATAYTSPDVLEWERRRFFDRSWMCLGRAGAHRRAAGQIERGGWAFVRNDAAGVDPDEQFGNLWEHLAPWEPERLVVAARHSYEIAANWKLIHENYQECYHCSEIHPELCRVTPPDSGYSIDIRGLYVAGPMDLYDGVETMSLDGRSHGVPIRGLRAHQLREVGYFGVFPNLLISPHPDYVLTHRIEPLSPARSFVECDWLFPPEALALDGFDPGYAVEFWDVTNREDWAACESLQRAVTSRGHRPGPMSTVWEGGVYMQVRMIAEGYLRGDVPGRPYQPQSTSYPRRELLSGT